MKTMYAITRVNKQGLRVLTLANQGRNHYEKYAEAVHDMNLFKNTGLTNVLDTNEINSLKVLEINCYDHGDSVNTVFNH